MHFQAGQSTAQGTEGDWQRRTAPRPETPPTGRCAFVHFQAVSPSNKKPPKPILPPQANLRPVGRHSTRLATETAHCHPPKLKSTQPVHIRSSLQGSYPDCIIPLWNSKPATILPARPQTRQVQYFKENGASIC